MFHTTTPPAPPRMRGHGRNNFNFVDRHATYMPVSSIQQLQKEGRPLRRLVAVDRAAAAAVVVVVVVYLLKSDPLAIALAALLDDPTTGGPVRLHEAPQSVGATRSKTQTQTLTTRATTHTTLMKVLIPQTTNPNPKPNPKPNSQPNQPNQPNAGGQRRRTRSATKTRSQQP